MKITSIRIYPFDTGTRGGKIRGVADVEIEGTLVIRGIRILEGRSGGLFLGMPSIRLREGEFRDTIAFIDKSFAAEFRRDVLDAYMNAGLICEDPVEGGNNEN
ncbi:SpoVG family protein [bacterium]|nr:SpoVG family protein [candidate division CSSED10-310 bacterium]